MHMNVCACVCSCTRVPLDLTNQMGVNTARVESASRKGCDAHITQKRVRQGLKELRWGRAGDMRVRGWRKKTVGISGKKEGWRD